MPFALTIAGFLFLSAFLNCSGFLSGIFVIYSFILSAFFNCFCVSKLLNSSWVAPSFFPPFFALNLLFISVGIIHLLWVSFWHLCTLLLFAFLKCPGFLSWCTFSFRCSLPLNSSTGVAFFLVSFFLSQPLQLNSSTFLAFFLVSFSLPLPGKRSFEKR